MTQPMPANEYDRQNSDRNLPIPDPTRLTTQLVDRALAAFREVMETRLEAMDKATNLLAGELDKIEKLTEDQHRHMATDCTNALQSAREYILSQIKNVADVSNEKFTAIATQFAERDTRTEQAAQESRISLDAALAAAKEAVSEQNKANALAIGKSEDATKERLDALALLMTTSVTSLDDKIADVKSRLDRGEGQGSGVERSRANVNQAFVIGIAAIGVLLGIASLVVSMLGKP